MQEQNKKNLWPSDVSTILFFYFLPNKGHYVGCVSIPQPLQEENSPRGVKNFGNFLKGFQKKKSQSNNSMQVGLACSHTYCKHDYTDTSSISFFLIKYLESSEHLFD